jgi:hypothetical protein
MLNLRAVSHSARCKAERVESQLALQLAHSR